MTRDERRPRFIVLSGLLAGAALGAGLVLRLSPPSRPTPVPRSRLWRKRRRKR